MLASMSGRLGFALAAACAAIAGCATPAAPTDGSPVELAAERLAAGDYQRALFYSENALQLQPFSPTAQEIELHLAVLRKLSRIEEAHAFAEFAARYAAGAPTDSGDTVPSRDDCQTLEHERLRSTRIVRDYGDLPARRHFEIGAIAASYEIDADGRPIHFRVLRARHPASAWLILASLSEVKIRRERLARVDEPFPIAHCAWWDEAIPKRVFIPPRMMR
jgi:hypothetical protein